MIRFAEEKDLERVNELRKQVNDVHVNGRPDIFKPGFGEDIKNLVYEMFQADDKDIIVAEKDGVICGMACVEYVSRKESPFGLARQFYHVSELAVDEAFQRQGIATEILTFIKQDAKERGLGKVELDVWEFNESAKKLYEKAGFHITRTFLECESGV